MRIASLVIGLFVGIVVFVQSCSIGLLGNLAKQEALQTEAGAGLLLGFLAIFGAAFAIGKPRVATWLFGIGAAIGIWVGARADIFGDLVVWGLILGGVAVMSFFAQPGREGGHRKTRGMRIFGWIALVAVVLVVALTRFQGEQEPGLPMATRPLPIPTSTSPTAPLPTPTSVPATPFPTVVPIPTPTATPTPVPMGEIRVIAEHDDLVLKALTQTQSWMGNSVLIGVVTNEGSSTIGVKVTLRFRNQAAKIEVDTHEAIMLLRGEVGPGEQVPFVSGLPEFEEGEAWDTVEVVLALDGFGAMFGGKRVNGLEVTQLKREQDGVSGTIYNGSEEVVGGTGLFERLEVAVIGYDAEGEMVVVGSDSVSRMLEPGWSTGFQVKTPGTIWGDPALAVKYKARVLEHQ